MSNRELPPCPLNALRYRSQRIVDPCYRPLRVAELLANPLLDYISVFIFLPYEAHLVHSPGRNLDDPVALPGEIRPACAAEPAEVVFDNLVVGEWRCRSFGGRGPFESVTGKDVNVDHDGAGLLAAKAAEAGY